MTTPDHPTLVKDAEYWLRNEQRCRPVMREPADTPECPDALGWLAHAWAISHTVEVKVSEADRKREHQKSEKYGDRMGHWGWLLCPAHLFEAYHAEELGLGLIYWHGPRDIRKVADPPHRNPRRDWKSEMVLLCRALNRVERWVGRTAQESRSSNRAKLSKAQHEAIRNALAEHGALEPMELARLIDCNGKRPGTVAGHIAEDAQNGLIEGVTAEGRTRPTLRLAEQTQQA